MNHKRKRTKRQRAGCKLCKPHKQNGVDDPKIQELKARVATVEQLEDADYMMDLVCFCEDCVGPVPESDNDVVVHTDGKVGTNVGDALRPILLRAA